MSRTLRALTLILPAILIAGPGASGLRAEENSAASSAAPGAQPFEVTAEDPLTIDLKTGEGVLRKNARFVMPPWIMTADEIRVNYKTNEAFASGHIVLMQPGLRVLAETAHYNHTTREIEAVTALALPVVLAFANPVGAQQSLEVPPVATPVPSAAPTATATPPPRGYPGGEAGKNVPKTDRTSNLPTRTWEGYVVHASAQSVRVHSPAQHRDLTFLVFSSPRHLTDPNGMQTYAMSELPPGTRIKVVYTQMMGVRHAYVIYIYRADGTIKKMHG